jgi:hypothetical protein
MEYSTCTEGIITVKYTLPDQHLVSETLDHLSQGLTSCMQYFQVDTFSGMCAVLTPSRAEFDRIIREELQVDIESPSSPARVALPQQKTLAILSPRLWEEESTHFPHLFNTILYHETVHIMEEYLSPDIEKVPRWWSEGLAIYVSDRWITMTEENLELTACIQNDSVPSLPSLYQDVRLSYLWGWTCVMYVELIYGPPMINTLVRECSDNIMAKLGETDSSFEEKWKRWLPLLESSLK